MKFWIFHREISHLLLFMYCQFEPPGHLWHLKLVTDKSGGLPLLPLTRTVYFDWICICIPLCQETWFFYLLGHFGYALSHQGGFLPKMLHAIGPFDGRYCTFEFFNQFCYLLSYVEAISQKFSRNFWSDMVQMSQDQVPLTAT